MCFRGRESASAGVNRSFASTEATRGLSAVYRHSKDTVGRSAQQT